MGLGGEFPMQRNDIAEQVKNARSPFSVTLRSGEQICCKEIISFDDALTVSIGESDLITIFPHDIEKIFFGYHYH